MYRICENCKDKTISFLEGSHGPDAVTVWSEWVTETKSYEAKAQMQTRKTIKKVHRGTVSELKELFVTEINRFASHCFNITHQFRQ